MGSLQGIFHVLDGVAHRHLQVDLSQLLDEQVTVFRVHDGFDAGSKHLNTILLQYAALVELSTTVQGSLATESQENTVRTLFFNNLCDKVRGYRLKVNLVGNSLRRLDRSDVGVY